MNFKVGLLLIIFVSCVFCKSIQRSDKQNQQNENENEVKSNESKDVSQSDEKEENITEITETEVENSTKNVNQSAASTKPSDEGTRTQRTVGRLREVENPLAALEAFKNKLKTARAHLEEQKRKPEPRLFIYDPNETINKKFTAEELKPNLKILPQLRTVHPVVPFNEKPKEDKQINEQPPETSKMETEEREERRETEKSENIEMKNRNDEEDSDIKHLLHVREEITKLRQIMQILKEQQLRKGSGTKIPQSANMTDDQESELETLIEKLKKDGKISTSVLESDDNVANLVEDIKNLKKFVLKFTEEVDKPDLEKLENKIDEQREEIEQLKKIVDRLQPKPILNHPQMVKSNLHEELKDLQEILGRLLKKPDDRSSLRTAGQNEKLSDEMSTIIKLFKSIPNFDRGRQSLESKLDKLEHELKILDQQNQQTRQSMLLDRLEKEINLLKSSNSNINSKQIDPLQSKINKLENQMKHLTKPNEDIEKELEKLQKEIGILTKQNLNSQIQADSPTKFDHFPSKIPDISFPNFDPHLPMHQIPFCLQTNPHYAPHQPNPPEIVDKHEPSKIPEDLHFHSPKLDFEPIKFLDETKFHKNPPHFESFNPHQEFSPSKAEEDLHFNPPGPINHEDEHKPVLKPPILPPIFSSHHEPETKHFEVNKHIFNKEIHPIYPPSVPKATPVKIQYKDPHLFPYPSAVREFHPFETPQTEVDQINGMLEHLDEKLDFPIPPNFEYNPKYKSRNKRSSELETKEKLYTDIKYRLANLKEVVKSMQGPENRSDFQRAAEPYYDQNLDEKTPFRAINPKKRKFDELFIKFVKFMIHKFEIAAPVVVDSLFDDNYENFEVNYREAEVTEPKKNGGNVPLSNFQGFPGLFGFVPTFLFKLLSYFSYVLSYFKQNNFFKNFVFPSILIMAVNGIMTLLTWWFTTDNSQISLIT